MNITITTIPHKAQRYPTAGDWQIDTLGNLLITISALGDWRYEFLVALHELVEVVLCIARGIPQDIVDAFDMAWQEHDGLEEPGDDPAAPYHKEHQLAECFERWAAVLLLVKWRDYEKALDALYAS